ATALSMSERNPTIDIAKGLGIILVVLGHNWIVAHEHGELFRVIFSFHMPLFFFLSGVVLKGSDSFRQFAFHRADTLLKPYLLVLSTWGLARIVLASVPIVPYFLGLLYGTGYTIEWVPLWYLPHLFIALLVSWCLLRCAGDYAGSRRVMLAMALISLLVGILTRNALASFDPQKLDMLNHLVGNKENVFPGLPLSIDLLGFSLAFILSGYAFKEYVFRFRFRIGYFIAALVAFSALHFNFDETIDLHMRQYGVFWIATSQAALGIYLSLSIAALLQGLSKLAAMLAYIGAGSLFILIFHSWMEWKVFNILEKLHHQAMLNGMLSLLVGIAGPLLLLALVRKQAILSRLLLPAKKKPS
ncbi:MAG: acyltransferase family protein, partial [Burkholderiales bacterium]|nr:acyltransferase family protein [Burkholderiales bacterium]